MFGIKELKHRISVLEFKVVYLNDRALLLETPQKFKYGDKVSLTPFDKRGDRDLLGTVMSVDRELQRDVYDNINTFVKEYVNVDTGKGLVRYNECNLYKYRE